MRICYPFIGDSLGGSHHSSIALIGALPERITPIVVLQRRGVLAEHLDRIRMPWRQIGDLPVFRERGAAADLRWQVRELPGFAERLRELRCAIVHTNDLRCHLSWGMATRLGSWRWCWHQRTCNGSRRIGLLARLADQVVHISRATQRSFSGPRGVVVANPVRPGQLSGPLPAGWPVAADRVWVGVGNLGDQKRPAVAVRALAEVGTGTHLVWIGPDRPPAAERLRALATELGVSERVHLLGELHPASAAIAHADVVVAPAVGEGHGRVLIEAMVLGTPIVAAGSGGHEEIISHGVDGLLVPVDDPVALATGADRAVQQRDRLAHAARRSARRFGPTIHVATMMRIYQRIMSRCGRT